MSSFLSPVKSSTLRSVGKISFLFFSQLFFFFLVCGFCLFVVYAFKVDTILMYVKFVVVAGSLGSQKLRLSRSKIQRRLKSRVYYR